MVSYSRKRTLFERLPISHTVSIVSGIVIILALPVILFFLQKQTNVEEHAAGSGYPQVVGTHIVDANGSEVHLVGTMIDGPFAYISSWQQGVPVNKIQNIYGNNVFATIKAWKMNLVRLNTSQWIAQNVMNYPYTQNDYMSNLDNVIALANSYGLYVDIDFHNNSQSGAPNKYSDDMMHQTTLSWWVSLANRYKGNPKIFFDFENEPGYPDWCSWAYGGDPARQVAHNCTSSVNNPDIVGFVQVTNAVRQTGAQNLITVEPGSAGAGSTEGGGWASFPLSYITDQNTFFQKHEYGGIIQNYLLGNPGQLWKAEWGPLWGAKALYYGEFAVLPNPLASQVSKCTGLTSKNANSITNTFLKFMKNNNINWTGWTFLPDQIIQDYTSYKPTNFSGGAPWKCPTLVNGVNVPPPTALHDGMGADMYNFLMNNY